MKKLLLPAIIVLLAFLLPCNARAQHHFGALGGVSFKVKDYTRYHAGLTYEYKTSNGFGVQPSLLVHAKRNAGYMEVPLGLQWGPDLLAFRPYVEVQPYGGYKIYDINGDSSQSNWEAGVGVGLGVEVWHFQISAHYSWNFVPVSDTVAAKELNVWTVTLAILFGK